MKTDDSASLQLPKVFSSAAFAASKRKTPSEFVLCQGVLPVMFPSLAAVWIFHFLEWTESLVTARLSRGTRGALEPILLQLTERAVRHATGVRGHRQAWESEHFPGFNIVRLWRLSCGYLKEILEGRHVGHGVGTSFASSKCKLSTTRTTGKLAGRKSAPDGDVVSFCEAPYGSTATSSRSGGWLCL